MNAECGLDRSASEFSYAWYFLAVFTILIFSFKADFANEAVDLNTTVSLSADMAYKLMGECVYVQHARCVDLHCVASPQQISALYVEHLNILLTHRKH